MISHGMRITFDPDFDSGFWPDPLHGPYNSGRKASAREPWVGPLGLLLTMSLGFLFTISNWLQHFGITFHKAYCLGHAGRNDPEYAIQQIKPKTLIPSTPPTPRSSRSSTTAYGS